MVFLNSGKIDINSKNNFGQTPLHYAATYGNIESIKLLVEKSAALDEVDMNGKTALMCASIFKDNIDKHINTINYLISKGADKKSIDSEGHDYSTYIKESINF